MKTVSNETGTLSEKRSPSLTGLTIDVVTLFKDFFKSPLNESLLKKAQDKGLVKVRVHDLRDWTHDRHKTADDKPFGGGVGNGDETRTDL